MTTHSLDAATAQTANAEQHPAVAADYARELNLDATPDVVFDALSTLSGLAGWWAPVTGSGAGGGELRFTFPNSEEHALVIAVDAAERPRSVAWTVLAAPPVPDWVEWAGTHITFALESRPSGGTTVAFRHQGLSPRLHCYEHCSRGWDGVLASLRAYVDTGTGHPFGAVATAPSSVTAGPAAVGTSDIVRGYHEAWTAGDIAAAGCYLAAEFSTRAPVGSYDTKDAYLAGLTRFCGFVTSVKLISELYGDDEAMLLYDVDTNTPAGTLRTAEHFTLNRDRIASTQLVFDATEWKAMLARQGATVDADGYVTRP